MVSERARTPLRGLCQTAVEIRLSRFTGPEFGHEGRHVPTPRQRVGEAGRPAGWAPSSVRDVLGRPIYRGVIEWDRNPRNNERKRIKRNANASPLRIEAEGLRILASQQFGAMAADFFGGGGGGGAGLGRGVGVLIEIPRSVVVGLLPHPFLCCRVGPWLIRRLH